MIYLIIFASFVAGVFAGLWFATYFITITLRKKGINLKEEFKDEIQKKI